MRTLSPTSNVRFLDWLWKSECRLGGLLGARAEAGVLALVDALSTDEVDAEEDGRPAAERRPDWTMDADLGERECIAGRCWAGSLALTASAKARESSASSTDVVMERG